MYTVYILRTSKGTLYTGQTNNLERRLSEHKSHTKRSSKYMRTFDSFTLCYKEEFESRSEAMSRESQIKKMKREDKLKLIS